MTGNKKTVVCKKGNLMKTKKEAKPVLEDQLAKSIANIL